MAASSTWIIFRTSLWRCSASSNPAARIWRWSSRFCKEKRELHLQMRAAGFELALHRHKDVRNIIHVDDAAMRVEHLDEAAHVRAFELLGQIDEQPNRR